MYSIDLSILLNRAFGVAAGSIRRYGSLGADSNKGIEATEAGQYEELQLSFTSSDKTSVLGTPIIMPLTLKGGRYPVKDDQGQIQYVTFLDWEMPAASLIEINRAKVIQKTQIAGRNGSVKELISDDDFDIRIRGLIVNSDSDAPPEEGVRWFQEVVSVPQALRVDCELFDWLEIDEVVVYSYSLFQLEGFQHVMAYTLNLWSDSPVEVRLRDGL
jgi:hypothetical protein